MIHRNNIMDFDNIRVKDINKLINNENDEITYPDAVVDINMLVPESDSPKDFSEEDLSELAEGINANVKQN